MPQVTIYTKKACPYCNAAKELLKSKGVMDYHEIDIEENSEKREEMIQLSGRLTVPQIFIDKKHIGGYDDMKALDDKGALPL